MVAYDTSPQANRAVDVALSLAQSTDCKVLIFAVASLPKPATMVELSAVLDEARERFEKEFVRISKDAEQLQVELETVIAVGQPIDQVIHRSRTETVDLIILGHKANSWLARVIMASTTNKIMRYASCPLMFVR